MSFLLSCPKSRCLHTAPGWAAEGNWWWRNCFALNPNRNQTFQGLCTSTATAEEARGAWPSFVWWSYIMGSPKFLGIPSRLPREVFTVSLAEFRQFSQAQGVTFGCSVQGQVVGLNDLCVSLPAQQILWFCDHYLVLTSRISRCGKGACLQ